MHYSLRPTNPCQHTGACLPACALRAPTTASVQAQACNELARWQAQPPILPNPHDPMQKDTDLGRSNKTAAGRQTSGC